MGRRRKPCANAEFTKVALGLIFFGLLVMAVKLDVHNMIGRAIMAPLAPQSAH